MRSRSCIKQSITSIYIVRVQASSASWGARTPTAAQLPVLTILSQLLRITHTDDTAYVHVSAFDPFGIQPGHSIKACNTDTKDHVQIRSAVGQRQHQLRNAVEITAAAHLLIRRKRRLARPENG